MSPKILGISGHKGAGKDTAANWIIGQNLLLIGAVRNEVQICPQTGKLWISDLFADDKYQGYFDLQRDNFEMECLRVKDLNPFIRVFSYAGLLKREVCMKIMGLSEEQCFGTDEEKNSLTEYRWENMPGIITDERLESALFAEQARIIDGKHLPDGHPDYPLFNVIYHKPGLMKAREVMQYVGTDMFRKMNAHIWTNALERMILDDQAVMSVICDVRFENEIKAVQKMGGKVLRLTRSPRNDGDSHQSEIALDTYTGFDFIIDNVNMDVSKQCEALYKTLNPIGWTPDIIASEEA